MALRLDGIMTEFGLRPWVAPLVAVPITVTAFVYLGLYRAIVRYIAGNAIKAITAGVLISAIVVYVISQVLTLGVPRSVPGIYVALLLITVGGTRFLMRGLYVAAQESTKAPVVIYGAQETGLQLVRSLQQSRNFRASLFIDDDPKIIGSIINGVPVVGPNYAANHIASKGIKTALISISDTLPEARRKAGTMLANLGLEIRVIPNVSDLVSGKIRISELRRITVAELLGREAVPPISKLMSHTILDKSVLITGAGGSIGSELCRQILAEKPSCLILLDASEFSLYTIHEELAKLNDQRNEEPIVIVPVLGSVINEALISRIIKEYGVQTLFHAAAYKHVPLVEDNIIEGIRNNVLGTKVVAQAAGKAGVANFTLISTDKAVRPTNVMGATKRIAELIVQSQARCHSNTKYCAVRFGNVLGSSGSVIPKFQQQIDSGGPLTVTHKDITRYFMTIPEAAQLVVQASALAESGEIYLLDMGEPVKILDLARTMVRLSGRDPYVEELDDPLEAGANCFPIQITGLRPGEKLFEELLVSGIEQKTLHPRIMVETVNTKESLPIDQWNKIVASLLEATEPEDALAQIRQLNVEYTRSA